jgi:hypothetical protein
VNRAVLGVVLAACSSPSRTPAARPDTGVGAFETDELKRKRLLAELEDDILSSYQRDDLPDIDTQMIAQIVGPARIGVGPGDVLFGDDVRQRASSRWPLYLGPSVATEVRSKHLDIHLAADKPVSAAWAADELSWRISICGHSAVIPLRLTALYAHDGDRWVEVFEHLSWARVPQPYFAVGEGGKLVNVLRGSEMIHPRENPVVDRKLADELSAALQALMSRQPARIGSVVSLDPKHRAETDPSQPAPTLLLAPDLEGEWHGDEQAAHVQLVDGTLRAEDRRIGTVGPSVARSTIAYWVGNFVADLAARPGIEAGTKVRLRGTFVFEKRPGTTRWIVVQGHLSEPIDDFDLASEVFGSSLAMSEQDFLRKKPLQVTCDDGRRAKQSAASPTTALPARATPGPVSAPTPAPAADSR